MITQKRVRKIKIPSFEEVRRSDSVYLGSIGIGIKTERKQIPGKKRGVIAKSEPVKKDQTPPAQEEPSPSTFKDQTPPAQEGPSSPATQEPSPPNFRCNYCKKLHKNMQSLRIHLKRCPKRVKDLPYMVGKYSYTVTLNPVRSATTLLKVTVERLTYSDYDEETRHRCMTECLELLRLMNKIKSYTVTTNPPE